jgi:hypothetical protein
MARRNSIGERGRPIPPAVEDFLARLTIEEEGGGGRYPVSHGE